MSRLTLHIDDPSYLELLKLARKLRRKGCLIYGPTAYGTKVGCKCLAHQATKLLKHRRV